MILSFPTPCMRFEATHEIDRGALARPVHMAGLDFKVISPIDIKPGDMLLIDLRSQRIEVVTRDGIAIYRSGWLN